MRFVGLKGNATEPATHQHPNRFFPVMRRHWQEIKDLVFAPPYIPAFVLLVINSALVLVLFLFAVTIGVCSQIWEWLLSHAEEHAALSRKEAHPISKSTQAVMAGVFVAFAAPFFIVTSPFELIGLAYARVKGDAKVQPSLFTRLGGTGAFTIIGLAIRLGWIGPAFHGIAFLWSVTTGLGGHDSVVAALSNATNSTGA